MTRIGRPTKLTPAVQKAIVDAISSGNFQEIAARYAGINPATFYNWMSRGRTEAERLANNPRAKPKTREKPFLEFFEAVEKARADAEVRNIALINNAAMAGNWQAAAWWLERTRPDRYGRRDRLNVTVRQEAERLAAEFGLDVDDVIAEAERILRQGK